MKLNFALLLALPLALSAPAVSAQTTPSDEDMRVGYAMTMMCLQATAYMSVEAKDKGDTAAYDRMTGEGVIFLTLANDFGGPLGRSVDTDFGELVDQTTAEEVLLKPAVALARQRQVYEACQVLLTPASPAS